MTQQNSTTNFVIHDSNGQPQMIKVVQSSGKPISGIMTSAISGQTVKILKPSALTGHDTPQPMNMNTAASHLFKAISSSPKVITKSVPIGTLARVSQRGPDGQLIQKTVRLAPSQMQNLKFVNTSTQQKVQITQGTLMTPTIIQSPTSQKYISPPILDHSGARKRQDIIDPDFTPEFKRRKSEKVGKGLRHFSMKVCEKVRRKGTTSYNEVADELVGEFTNSVNSSLADQQYDQKNIRRRVYDALNVLMAMNIISKEKKEIRWLGLPTNSLQECIQLEKDRQKKIQVIREKTKKLQDLILNQVAFKSLALRNKNLEINQGIPQPNSYITLPFIVVNTNKKTVIDCSISNDKLEYLFHFSDKFEIHDDVFVLKQIGMLLGLDTGDCSPTDLEKIKSMVPKSLEQYVLKLANGTKDPIEDILGTAAAGPSSLPLLNVEDLVETQLDEDNSRQSSSYDPLSPSVPDFSDEDVDSDISSETEAN